MVDAPYHLVMERIDGRFPFSSDVPAVGRIVSSVDNRNVGCWESTLKDMQALARKHLWMHFSRLGAFEHEELPIITRGEGCYVWDQHGKRYLDGLSGLFVVQLGHGRKELAEAAGRQAEQLAYFPIWSYAHPPALELADAARRARARRPQPRLLHDRRLRGGGVGVEAGPPVLPRHRPAAPLQGDRPRHRVPRHDAWARSPSPASPRSARRSSRSRRARCTCRTPTATAARMRAGRAGVHARVRPTPSRTRSSSRDPRRSPRCSSSRCRTAAAASRRPTATSQRVREICDRYGVLLVSDEVICAFGRLGHMFGCERYDYLPDIITSAKGLTSGYSPLGAVICRDLLAEPFLEGSQSFSHGITFGGHPVSCAVGARQPRHLRARRTCSATCGPTRPSFRAAARVAARHPDRRRRPRRRLLLRDRAGEGPGDEGDVRPTTRARRCCAASSRRVSSRPA